MVVKTKKKGCPKQVKGNKDVLNKLMKEGCLKQTDKRGIP